MGLHLRSLRFWAPLGSPQIPRGLERQNWRSASPAASQESLTSPHQAGPGWHLRLALCTSCRCSCFVPRDPRAQLPRFLPWAGAWLGCAKLPGQEGTWTLRYRSGLIPWGWQEEVSYKCWEKMKTQRTKYIKMTLIKCSVWNAVCCTKKKELLRKHLRTTLHKSTLRHSDFSTWKNLNKQIWKTSLTSWDFTMSSSFCSVFSPAASLLLDSSAERAELMTAGPTLRLSARTPTKVT